MIGVATPNSAPAGRQCRSWIPVHSPPASMSRCIEGFMPGALSSMKARVWSTIRIRVTPLAWATAATSAIASVRTARASRTERYSPNVTRVVAPSALTEEMKTNLVQRICSRSQPVQRSHRFFENVVDRLRTRGHRPLTPPGRCGETGCTGRSPPVLRSPRKARSPLPKVLHAHRRSDAVGGFHSVLERYDRRAGDDHGLDCRPLRPCDRSWWQPRSGRPVQRLPGYRLPLPVKSGNLRTRS